MLRAAYAADQDVIADVWRTAWASANPDAEYLEPHAYWLRRVLEEFKPPRQTFVYEADGQGILAFMLLDMDAAHLHQLFVRPEAQAQGIGSRLLAQVSGFCPGGWSLHVATTNSRARRFYARHGLVEGPVSRHPYTDRERVLCSWRPHPAKAQG